MASIDEAKSHIDEIAKDNGELNQACIERMKAKLPEEDQEGFEDFTRNLKNKNQIIGRGLVRLAKDLYSSDTRFVFELLQNADDNNFEDALKDGELPCVTFDLRSDCVVVECNEDGFTKDDVCAICGLDESTKVSSAGHIGAKGIGFKSVFRVASKVSIQSGYYSFYLEHKDNDNGFGMIVPKWDASNKEPFLPLTRMTLHLRSFEKKEEAELLHQNIANQLEEMSPTLLLFLRKLKLIDVNICNSKGVQQSHKTLKVGEEHMHRFFIDSSREKNTSGMVKERSWYHVTKCVAKELAYSKGRSYPETEEAKTEAATAEIILAFPINEDSVPILDRQQIYAFLPVRILSFKFLIQADFDTAENREDLDYTTKRNSQLLDHIATTYVVAISQFNEHSELCYEWAKFLPLEEDFSETFWKRLCKMIESQIHESPILKSRNGKELRRVDGIFSLPLTFQDEYGNPLLDDPKASYFVSASYTPGSLEGLKKYGLKEIGREQVLNLLEQDLELSDDSKWKSHNTDKNWHSRLASFLSQDLEFYIPRLQKMRLIPLTDHTWTALDKLTLYFPAIDKISVPELEGITLVDSSTIINEERRTLFTLLGIKEPPVRFVRSLISQKYHRLPSRETLPILDSISHLHFLFLTRKTASQSERYPHMYIWTESGQLVQPLREDVYIPCDDEYGPNVLLGQATQAEGFEASFIDAQYLEGPIDTQEADQTSWIEWLKRFVHVRSIVRLIAPDGASVSEAWKYVTIQSPEKALGLLEYLWEIDGTKIINSESLVNSFTKTPANRLCIGEVTPYCTLGETYLPLPKLTKCANTFMKEDESFPFLDVRSEQSDQPLSAKWLFLNKTFGVGIDDGIKFLLDILACIKAYDRQTLSLSRLEQVLLLYEEISIQCSSPSASQDDRDLVRDYFKDKQAIFIPSQWSEKRKWVSSSECFWNGPQGMATRKSLQPLYSTKYDQMPQALANFFQLILALPDATDDDVLEELQRFKFSEKAEDSNFDRITSMYEYLSKMSMETLGEILRSRFQRQGLIFAQCNGKTGWYRTSECLWTSIDGVQSKVILSEDYEQLKEFFVGVIRVRTMTVQTILNELLRVTTESSEKDVQALLISFSTFLKSHHFLWSPSKLLEKPIFNVVFPDGSTSLQSLQTSFHIVDRESLAQKFSGEINVLKCSLDQFRELQPFFEWARLTGRYLSLAVKMFTSVAVNAERRKVSSGRRDIKRKAHAILRVAATFKSPRYHEDAKKLYQQLGSITVNEVEEIECTYSLIQGQSRVEVKESTGNLHCKEENSKLEYYIPRPPAAQELCFTAVLPSKLGEWLMADQLTDASREFINALTSVLSVESDAVSNILDYLGIVTIDIPNEDPNVPDSRDIAESVEYQDGNLQASGAEPAGDSPRAYNRSLTPQRRRVSSVTPTPSYGETDEDKHYRALLKRVVAAAKRSLFPPPIARISNDTHGRGEIFGFDWDDTVSRFRSSSKLTRDKKIGAAGELYVYQLLRGLDLDKWDVEEVWKSRIRHYASLHPDYKGITTWEGRETADLVYNDTLGKFTHHLIQHGLLNEGIWQGATPRYYIEVKSTTGPCQTPFYMSRAQHKIMSDIHQKGVRTEVYMILRVFDIESQNVGVAIYLDPHQLYQAGELTFVAHTWSVTPKKPAQSTNS